MATVYELLDERRAALAAIDNATADEMTRAYTVLIEDAGQAIDELMAQIDEALAAGVTVSPSWLYQSSRYQALISQLQTQLATWAANATVSAAEAQRLALAELQTLDLLTAVLGQPPAGVSLTFASVPLETLNAMIGFAADGTPLAALMAAASVAGITATREALIRGIALGYGTARVAREVRDTLAIPLLRATTISRTEMHRAYREGVRQSMAANADLLEGWVWRAARDGRTCSACWAMDGTLHPASEVMAEHPNGRCAQVPRAKTYAEILGDPSLPDNRVPLVTGEDRFAALSYARQREILGPGHHDLYRAGLSLAAMVERLPNATWGPTMVLRPLSDLTPPPLPPIDFRAAVAELARRRAALGVTTAAVAREMHIDFAAVLRLEAGRGTRIEQIRYRIALDRLTHGKAGSLARAA